MNKKYFKNQKLENFLILLRSSGYNAAPYDRYSEGLSQLDLTVKLCKKFSPELIQNTIQQTLQRIIKPLRTNGQDRLGLRRPGYIQASLYHLDKP